MRDLASRPAVLTAAALLAVLVAAAGLRLTGVNWDAGAHLHPDERYLSIVAEEIAWPSSPAEYLDVEGSRLSPYNTARGETYVYGLLPLIATKGVATVADRDGYDRLHLVGRRLSAVLDTLSVALVFLIGTVLLGRFGRRTAIAGALLAAALYALSPLAIQHAHFFTVEAWLVVTTLVAFYLALLVARRPLDAGLLGSLGLLAALGAAIALVTATKLSGLLILAPVLLALALRPAGDRAPAARAVSFVAATLVVGVSGYLAFRLASPYAFAHSSWLDLQPNADYRAALEAQERAIGGDFLFPPAYQWLLSQPLVDPLHNLVVWGLGLPLGLAAMAGTLWLAGRAAGELRPARGRGLPADLVPALMLLAYVLVTFAYFGSRFAHSIRYLVPIVPFLCIAAAFAALALHARHRRAGLAAAAVLCAGTALYALAFTQIYRHPHSRVAATQWIAANVAPGSAIVNEHWDDGLPIGAPPDRYRLGELPVFDPDDADKLRKLHAGLADADYYNVSSPRAAATIGRLPGRFPLMSRFYRLLARGQLGFRPAARFTSYPRLAGVTLVDRGAEEAFWVYDHPPVVIYERVEPASWPRFRAVMCAPGPAPGCPRSR